LGKWSGKGTVLDFFFILGLEMRILEHYPAHMTEYLLLYFNTSRSRSSVYASQCSVTLSYFRLTVPQSKALHFLQKRAQNIFFPGGEYATNLNTVVVVIA